MQEEHPFRDSIIVVAFLAVIAIICKAIEVIVTYPWIILVVGGIAALIYLGEYKGKK